jgi:hypothetical protein
VPPKIQTSASATIYKREKAFKQREIGEERPRVNLVVSSFATEALALLVLV